MFVLLIYNIVISETLFHSLLSINYGVENYFSFRFLIAIMSAEATFELMRSA